MVEGLRHAQREWRHDHAERARIRAALWRETADLLERRRQQYHGHFEARRLMREEARALLQRLRAEGGWSALRRARRTAPEDPEP